MRIASLPQRAATALLLPLAASACELGGSSGDVREAVRAVGSSTVYPFATARIEELIDDLKERSAIVIVTHSMHQAARVSQRTAFFHLGVMVEYGDTSAIFTNPREERTKDYITGRYG